MSLIICHTNLRFQEQEERKSQCIHVFQTIACGMFVNALMDKTSHSAKPDLKIEDIYLHSAGQDLVWPTFAITGIICSCKGLDT